MEDLEGKCEKHAFKICGWELREHICMWVIFEVCLLFHFPVKKSEYSEKICTTYVEWKNYGTPKKSVEQDRINI